MMQELIGCDFTILDALEAFPGLLVTDPEGKILYINENYARLLDMSRDDLIGQDCTKVFPGTRMHVIAKTGKEEIGKLFRLINNESIIINRIPIWKKNMVVGVIAYSTLSNTNEYLTTATIENIKQISQEVSQYKSELKQLRGARYSIDRIIGANLKIQRIKELIKKVAYTKSTVLISGETGTGKELVAHAIHEYGPRSHNPFVRINCAAIPDNLLESEIFGYDEGAFTGAKRGGKVGKFEQANQGTIFMDEINQLPFFLQPKILRVLQEKEIDRLGGTRPPIELDVRFIFSTNHDLEELINIERFRKDLYYRINVINIEVPPLRERLDDLPLLIDHLLEKINREQGLYITGVHEDVLEIFKNYHWPGNIRELEHVLEQAANFALKGILIVDQFSSLNWRINNMRNDYGNEELTLQSIMANAEKDAIIKTLTQTNGNIRKAAEILHIHKTVLYHKIRKYEIQH